MYTTNDIKRLAGLSWDEFFRLVDHKQTSKQAVTLSVKSKCNEDVAMLPHRKATCYGSCAVTETPKLVKCQSCGLIVKTVAFGHHQKIHHNQFCSPMRRSASSDSDSDDDCQSFLLSPPHHPTPTMPSSTETMLDLKFVEDTKWTISDPFKIRSLIDDRNSKTENDQKILRQSPPRYDVQRRNDLRLVLTKRRSSIAKPKTHKVGVVRNQTTPLVSISITRSSGPKRNCVEITKHNMASKQTINADKGKGKWSNIQLTGDIFMADLEESEQSSIPLHHSPSESSDSEMDANDQQGTVGSELPESYLCSPHELMRDQCSATFPIENTTGWNPRSAAERPSKSNNTALILKMQQKKDLIQQQRNDDFRGIASEQPIVHKRTVTKKKERPAEKPPGISVMALSPDGKRKMAIPNQKHVPSNSQVTEIADVGTDSRNEHLQFPNEKRNSNGQKMPIISSLGQRQHETSNASSHLQILNTMLADESSEPRKSGGSLPTDSQPNGTFFVRQHSEQRKTSASFAGVSWHKPMTAAHCLPNVSKIPNANPQKGTLRFVPLNSANEHVAEQRQEDVVIVSKKAEKTRPIRDTNTAHSSSSSPQKFTQEYDNAIQPMDSDLQSAEFVCHIRQNVHPSSVGSPSSSVSFFGQNPNRKSSFVQQQKPKQPIHQPPIVAKRFRPIAPRKRLYNADDECSQFSVQPRGCAAEMFQHPQSNLPCRPSHSHQNFDQRFHPKIHSVFPPPPSVGSFGNSAPAVEQLSPSGDFRSFGRQSRQLFSVKHHQQTHPTRQSRAQFPQFDTSFLDDSRNSKNFDPQIGGVHGPMGLVTQRISSDYSYSQMSKTTAPCAHLHQCQTYGGPISTASTVPCSSAFLFAASPPPHPPPSSSFNGPFPSVHHLSDSLSPPHQQHLLLHQQHFHPLAVLPAPQCRHSCARPSPSSAPPSMHSQFSLCRGGVVAGMASPHSEPFFLPPSYTFQQQQIPHHFMRGEQQQQRQNYVVTYDNEMDPEICSMEPPPVLEAEGNISTPAEEEPTQFEEGGVTTRSDSDASDMDLREFLPQQQK